MLAPLLALALSAATPRATLAAPHGQNLADLRAFLESASAYSPSLSPGPLGRAMGAALSLDVFDLAAWHAAGLDPSGPVTLVAWKGGSFTLVLPVKDAAKVATRARTGLASAGTVKEDAVRGGKRFRALRPALDERSPELAGAVLISGKRAVILASGGDLSALDASLTGTAIAAPRADGLAGTLTLTLAGDERGKGAVLKLQPSAQALGIDGRLADPRLELAARGADPFAKLAVQAPLWAHAVLAPSALAAIRSEGVAFLNFLVHQVDRAGAEAQLGGLFEAMAGPVALIATGLAPERTRGDFDIDRYFLVRNVYAAQVASPEKGQAALHALLDALKQGGSPADNVDTAATPGEHHLLRLGARREVFFGLSGSVLYLANDAGARDALLGALGSAAGTNAGGVVALDGVAAAQALGKLSLLDAAGSRDQAALFALAVEAGPLLRALGTSPRLTLTPEGRGTRLRGTLELAPSGKK